MDFIVGPFAQNQQNTRTFFANLTFAGACSETIRTIADMEAANTKLTAPGKESALNANKEDAKLFMNLMFSVTSPIEKDV
jgi:hypothetical protein